MAKRATSRKSLKATAIALLARREFARAEIRKRLAARGYPREEIDVVLDDLERAGFLSDVRYAQAAVAQRAGSYAKRAIAHALKEKGVDASTAATALAELSHSDEVADAATLWQRRFGTPPTDEREKARHVRFLLSRGYSMSVALKVLRSAGARVDSDDAT